MATRDLTRSFTQLRADAKAKSLRRRNIGGGGHAAEEANALVSGGTASQHTALHVAPGWVDVVGDTNQHVARLTDMSAFGGSCVWEIVWREDVG